MFKILKLRLLRKLIVLITLLSKNLCDRCKEQMEIELSFTNTLKEYLIKKHADLKMGARPLKRAIVQNPQALPSAQAHSYQS